MDILKYLNCNNLFDYETLKAYCERHLVWIIESDKYPGVIMLHYKPEAHFEKQWSEFSLSCRGLILDMKSKTVLAYPFDKFFNLDEMPETRYDNLKTAGSFEVSEKLDGSMLIMFKDPNTGNNVVTTKGSFDSEHGEYANTIIPNILQMEGNPISDMFYLMFELISDKFRIVVDYSKKEGYQDGIYLIGARQKSDNRLLSYAEVQTLGKTLRLPTMRTYREFKSIDDLVLNAKALSVLDEGYVMRFENGVMAKVKGDKYLAAHRFISKLSPKYILESMGLGVSEELIRIAPEEYRDDVTRLIGEFLGDKREIEALIDGFMKMAPKDTRKEFALWVQANVPDDLKSLMFVKMDGKEITMNRVYKIIGARKQISHETKL